MKSVPHLIVDPSINFLKSKWLTILCVLNFVNPPEIFELQLHFYTYKTHGKNRILKHLIRNNVFYLFYQFESDWTNICCIKVCFCVDSQLEHLRVDFRLGFWNVNEDLRRTCVARYQQKRGVVNFKCNKMSTTDFMNK